MLECIPTRRIQQKGPREASLWINRDGTALSDSPTIAAVASIPTVAAVTTIPTVATISSVAAIDRSIAAIDCTISAAIGGIAHHGCCDNR